MSGTHDGAPDPLAALRASDRRPRTEVWRERLAIRSWKGQLAAIDLGGVRSSANRLAIAGLVVALGFGVAWRLFVGTEPPVEDSIPFATAEPVESNVTTDGEVDAAITPTAAAAASSVEFSPPDHVVSEAQDVLPEVVVVHMAGAVERPGLVTGDTTWRIDDALRAAGGAIGSADLDRVNLAAPIIDGQRIFVPHIDQEVPNLVLPVGSGRSVGSDPSEAAGELGDGEVVDINAADSQGLERLPGVGPATAAAILSHREQFGAFGSVDALVSVPGIGPATLEALREYVAVTS